MNAIMVWEWMLRPIWAWMIWSSDADEHERYNGLGVDALVIGCSPTWFGHGCSGHRMQKMNVIMVWAWMLWSSDAVKQEGYYGMAWMLWSPDAVKYDGYYGMAWMLWSPDAVKHEHYYGLGMDTLVTGRSQT